ncbi:MAG: hypothetical protein ACJAVJ_001921 [Planctomycetota bacterium]|jgi:hypothetical protein
MVMPRLPSIDTRPSLLGFAALGLALQPFIHVPAQAQDEATPEPATVLPTEADYYELRAIAPQAGLVGGLGDLSLEVGGLCFLGDDSLLAATRRGEVWLVKNYSTDPVFHLWADGLHEPLGLLPLNGWIYFAQRGELSRMRDSDGDLKADEFEVVNEAWSISGNYHEYAFGPVLDTDGNFWVTLNRPFGDGSFEEAEFRGWAAKISPDGSICEMAASGLRSPAGIGRSPWGELFYTDNQGEWCPANKLSLLEEGVFYGHPWGIDSSDLPMSQVAYPMEAISLDQGGDDKAKPDQRNFEELYRKGELIPKVAARIPSMKLPAIWFPYDKLGRSASGFDWDESGGTFGPFAGQLFVGDQFEASVNRVALEQVDGIWQGAAFPFRRGLASGVIRARFDKGEPALGIGGRTTAEAGAKPASPGLVVGMSDRGWASLGSQRDGLQRIVWTGELPFEIHSINAIPSGFRLNLTQPCDLASVTPEAFTLKSYTYSFHEAYGSPELDNATLEIASATSSSDGLTVTLVVGSGALVDEDGEDLGTLPAPALRQGYVHELEAPGLRALDSGHPLLHPDAYYTLNRIPK